MFPEEQYPLTWPVGWPRTQHPNRSHFGKLNDKPSIAKASNFLLQEVKRLTGSSRVVVSTNLRYKQDGMPYSNQREPDDQGVAAYFIYGGEQMVIACDSYDRIGCNIYA